MKYAILGDIHANLEALQAVLSDAEEQGVDRFACTGDLIGYNADPKACMQIIRSLGCPVVQGNHDHFAASNESIELFTAKARKSIEWTRKQLGVFDRRYLRNLPLILDIENFTIVHSSLNNPSRWTYVLQRNAAEASFSKLFNPVCFYGHTHLPMAFIENDGIEKTSYDTLHIQPDRRYIINVGSVGQPRDGNPKSTYVIYDLERQTVTLRRLEYDMETTQRKIREAGLPFRNALRLSYGR